MKLTIHGRREGCNGLPVAESLIDPQDAELARGFRWYLGGRKRRYVMAFTPQGETILLHRLLVNAQPGQRVGHRNGDPLDNRQENLQLLD
ncbi:hypothetical protein [Deinococcus aluminii]|uniref:HNH nuclease domain-containing protein n=1 Tax=Deinococcus aluminii TaxID=1656885 RepID=A0ABP9XIH3_9DEIO